MNSKNILIKVLILLILILGYLILNNKENFDNHDNDGEGKKSCYTGCKNRNNASITEVCPNKPECVGICINQHTYTDKNISEDSLKNEEDIGSLKSDQTKSDVISTNCGLCISNFYTGLKLMNDLGTQCSQN